MTQQAREMWFSHLISSVIGVKGHQRRGWDNNDVSIYRFLHGIILFRPRVWNHREKSRGPSKETSAINRKRKEDDLRNENRIQETKRTQCLILYCLYLLQRSIRVKWSRVPLLGWGFFSRDNECQEMVYPSSNQGSLSLTHVICWFNRISSQENHDTYDREDTDKVSRGSYFSRQSFSRERRRILKVMASLFRENLWQRRPSKWVLSSAEKSLQSRFILLTFNLYSSRLKGQETKFISMRTEMERDTFLLLLSWSLFDMILVES